MCCSVEGHADTVEMVTLMLNAGGFDVLSHSTIAAGLKASAAQDFDLYLIDSPDLSATLVQLLIHNHQSRDADS